MTPAEAPDEGMVVWTECAKAADTTPMEGVSTVTQHMAARQHVVGVTEMNFILLLGPPEQQEA